MFGPLVRVKIEVAVEDIVFVLERVIRDEQRFLNRIIEFARQPCLSDLLEPISIQLLCQLPHHDSIFTARDEGVSVLF